MSYSASIVLKLDYFRVCCHKNIVYCLKSSKFYTSVGPHYNSALNNDQAVRPRHVVIEVQRLTYVLLGTPPLGGSHNYL
jgi:hypothetical protein